MTISTSGYIAFGILISGAIVNSAYGRKHIYLLPLLSFLAFSIFLLLWNSDAVQKK
jgi:ABC-type Fe3+-siderophore transport system permease subunit